MSAGFASFDQHGVNIGVDTNQGHDPSLLELRRFIAAVACRLYRDFPRCHAAEISTRKLLMSLIVLAAGGTGGHVFPAMALARALSARGHDVRLLTDARGVKYATDFDPDGIEVIAAGGLVSGAPHKRVQWPASAWRVDTFRRAGTSSAGSRTPWLALAAFPLPRPCWPRSIWASPP